MAHVTSAQANIVRETSTVLGTSNVILLGAQGGYQSFASLMNPGDDCFGFIASRDTPQYEYSTFVMQNDGTLARTSPTKTSEIGNVLTTFVAGTKDVVLVSGVAATPAVQYSVDVYGDNPNAFTPDGPGQSFDEPPTAYASGDFNNLG